MSKIIKFPPAKYGGRYKIEAFRGITDIYGNLIAEIPGTRRLCADWFSNLITNQGLNYIGEQSDYLDACHVGTSSTAPQFTDTGLLGFIAGTANRTSNTTSAASGSPYYGKRIIVYRFGIGAAAGNLSEVGVGRTATTGNLFSRALIVDGVGAPTTITVLADEFLDVTFELRMYVPLIDVTGSTTLDGISRNYTIRAREATNVNVWGVPIGTIASGGWASAGSGDRTTFTGAIAAITSSPSGQIATTPNTVVDEAFVASLHYIDSTLYWQPGHSTGLIRCHQFISSVGSYQMEFLPVLDKTSPKALTHQFRYSWARH